MKVIGKEITGKISTHIFTCKLDDEIMNNKIIEQINLQGDKIMIAENVLAKAIKALIKRKLEKETDLVLSETSAMATGNVEGVGFDEDILDEDEATMFGAPDAFDDAGEHVGAVEDVLGTPDQEIIDPSAEEQAILQYAGSYGTDDDPAGMSMPLGMEDPEMQASFPVEEDLLEGDGTMCEQCGEGMHEGPCPNSIEESKILTPEQEGSFHSRLFGTRLVALNAKLMSAWIRK